MVVSRKGMSLQERGANVHDGLITIQGGHCDVHRGTLPGGETGYKGLTR